VSDQIPMRNLTDIINWRRLNHRITLSGQPTEKQLADIKRLGVSHIINLGPHTNEGALDDETGCVQSLGMVYIYIPVDFDNPKDSDFEAFCNAMERHRDNQVHVHCIYNARVTAFFYRYALNGNGCRSEMEKLMDGIFTILTLPYDISVHFMRLMINHISVNQRG